MDPSLRDENGDYVFTFNIVLNRKVVVLVAVVVAHFLYTVGDPMSDAIRHLTSL
jgi:hypothetical protein